jgi:hypothetical protein
MASRLPFTATTATGERFEISFPLHPHTASAVRVSQVVSAVLEAVDREGSVSPATANGDILQAVAMALAIRAAMIEAPKEITDRLAMEVVRTSLTAMDDADRGYVHVGHA